MKVRICWSRGRRSDGSRWRAKREFLSDETDRITVALAGNPNTGKTSLFNALTGLRHKVANYSGVTVEKREAVWNGTEPEFLLTDIPGLYSLEATSSDEKIARDALFGNINGTSKPDVVVVTVDSTNIERNLYLLTQLLDHDLKIVVAAYNGRRHCL